MYVRAGRGLFFVLAVAVLVSASAGCGMLEKPSARITGAQLQDVRATDATMLFDVEVTNLYAFSLPMSNVDYALSSRGQRFLTGQADIQGTIPAGGSKTLGVPVRISYVELVNAVEGARPGAKIPYTADLGLSMDGGVMGPLRVPVSKEGELAIPTTSGLLDRLRDIAQ
ncbi:MAG: LEA type 2 family protein [Phycisphaerae bacterium]